jgi:hypothetical protein
MSSPTSRPFSAFGSPTGRPFSAFGGSGAAVAEQEAEAAEVAAVEEQEAVALVAVAVAAVAAVAVVAADVATAEALQVAAAAALGEAQAAGDHWFVEGEVAWLVWQADGIPSSRYTVASGRREVAHRRGRLWQGYQIVATVGRLRWQAGGEARWDERGWVEFITKKLWCNCGWELRVGADGSEVWWQRTLDIGAHGLMEEKPQYLNVPWGRWSEQVATWIAEAALEAEVIADAEALAEMEAEAMA